MTRVFFDTEFAGLTSGAALISIGLVDEAGVCEFYAEAAEGWSAEACSAFCRAEVLVHLQGGGVQMPLASLRAELAAWLAARGPVVLVCDSRRDVQQLAAVFPGGLPSGVSVMVLGWWGNLRRRLQNRGRRLHRAHGLRVHHALDDARVNRMIFAGNWEG